MTSWVLGRDCGARLLRRLGQGVPLPLRLNDPLQRLGVLIPELLARQVVARNDATTEPDPQPSGSESPGDDSTVDPDTE
ncbi:hypothetical protein [Streptomyces sp. NPDC001978]|uniref:hypothetical protein n=1 Tax=Streptomyces sp. NPDC001978 TaxID=3364627 RepID=UPI0036C1F473